MHCTSILALVGGLASLGAASAPFNLAPLAQSVDGFATSLNPRFSTLPLHKRDLPTGTCNAQTPCVNGACCGKDGLCGYSPKSCGAGCQHNCDAKAQCGPYAPQNKQKCPLNVCCSEFGFCGSTPEFCTWTNKQDSNYPACDPKYGSCGDVKRPSCGGGNSVGKRNVGYYESWANTRKCSKVAPEDLALDGYTSINFAFSFFDPKSLQISPMDANGAGLYSRFTALKSKKPGLQTWISVGGWSFTDPGPTQTAFSDMAGNAGSRKTFIDGLIKFMDTYGFDGVDLDWEYPGAEDRGGKDSDAANYVSLCKEMRAAFGSKYGLTMTLPTSYWYLQHFDLPGVQSSVDWFNLMAYDLHGTWDESSKFVGPYIAPHTNITEIDGALDLLWRAGVDSSKVVLGQGYYGRSFTLKDPKCNTPNGVCEFSGGADAGPCSAASGILDYQEIVDIIDKNKLTPVHDEKAGVKWIMWNNNQWVSYDDKDTLKQKVDFGNSRCLGGMMVWAMDQVDQTKDNGFGAKPVQPGSAQDTANQATKDTVASLTCYTSNCNEACKPGTNSVAQFNGQPNSLSTADRCPKKQYRNLCCDAKTNMGTCQWRGYKGAALSCTGGCAQGETELTKNTNNHQKHGDQSCHGGLQSFCCADFKPSPGQDLKKDLADAAKAAAEAAAEQAALDIAAKAFCRIAVPALLAPLEALEDLIPIVGEILDIAEIAATPALIEACTKGIEKAGKAEFKVFGKKVSLSMDKPTGKPPNVPDRGAPKSGDKPTKTGDKDDGKKKCNKKKGTKRAPASVPTQTSYVDTPEFSIMKSTSKRSDKEISNCMSYAMNLKYPPLNFAHWVMIVGTVVYVEVERREVKNDCGEIDHVELKLRRDFDARPIDVGYSKITGDGNERDPRTNQVIPKGKLIKPIQLGADKLQQGPWIGLAEHFKGKGPLGTDPHWMNLGTIQRGYEFEEVADVGSDVAHAMGDYKLLTNNCQTWTRLTYAKLAVGTGIGKHGLNPFNACNKPPPEGYFPPGIGPNVGFNEDGKEIFGNFANPDTWDANEDDDI